MEGGPNWVNNVVDAPILLDTNATDVFYKQPMYYHLGHFAKFVRPEAVRVQLTPQTPHSAHLYAVAFVNPDRQTVVVVLNTHREDTANVVVHDPRRSSAKRASYLELQVPPESIQTLIW
jgi:glucosylceramidase